MKIRHFISFLSAIFVFTAAFGQSADSLAIVNAKWTVDSLDGFVLHRHHFAKGNCISSNQYVCVLEIPANSPCRLAFGYEPQRTLTSVHAKKHNALAAVNGSYFDMKEHYPICHLRIGGKEIGENTPQASDTVNRKYYQYGSLALNDGHPFIFIPDSNRLSERELPYSDIMTAGPLLIHEGRLMPMRADKTFVTDRHNRTAIGIRADGTVLLVTIDGRTRHSLGMSLTDFSKLLHYLGCVEALNLDGGGSTTTYVKGYPYHGIVNYPSDNRRFDHAGERPVSNCIMIVK